MVERLRLAVIGLVVGALVAGGWLAGGRAFASGDINESICAASTESSPGFRATLPDCRAYEIVSEANSGDTANVAGGYGFPEGMHVYYNSFLPTPGSEARSGVHERFLATRTAHGWEQTALSPPHGAGPLSLPLGVDDTDEGVTFSAGFAEAFLMSPFHNPAEEPELNETTSATPNIFVYSLSLPHDTVSLLSLPDSGPLTQQMIETPYCLGLGQANGCGAFLAGISADGKTVFFVTDMKLPTASGSAQDTHVSGNEIYERSSGHTYLVGVLPDGSVPSCGAEVGEGVIPKAEGEVYAYGTIATDGSNVVFTASDCTTSGLYMRDVLDGTTVRLPGSTYAGRAGTGPDEEEVIFTSDGAKFYAYHVTSRQTSEFGEGARGLLAYSADGSRVYYLGPEEGIYVSHHGETKVVPGTKAGGYLHGGSFLGLEFGGGGQIRNGVGTSSAETENMPAASGGTSNGSHLLFIDRANLTAYESDEHYEAYVYDVETEKVRCISCNLSNAPPRGAPPQGTAQLIEGQSKDVGELRYQTPWVPFISADGSRAVFETTEGLLPQDVNGTEDVYEWALAETNDCTASSPTYSAVDEGCIYLLSSGLGTEVPGTNFLGTHVVDGTHLIGASENLIDVYMQSSESLLPGLDNASHIYDVRINGGFPYTPASHGCEPGRCKAAAVESPMVGEPASVTFTDAGNSAAAHKLTRHQRQRRALKRCRRIESRHLRQRCRRRARKRFKTRTVRSRYSHLQVQARASSRGAK